MRLTRPRANRFDLRDLPCLSVGVANNSATACLESLPHEDRKGVLS
jgi:hypothetical protein